VCVCVFWGYYVVRVNYYYNSYPESFNFISNARRRFNTGDFSISSLVGSKAYPCFCNSTRKRRRTEMFSSISGSGVEKRRDNLPGIGSISLLFVVTEVGGVSNFSSFFQVFFLCFPLSFLLCCCCCCCCHFLLL